MLHTQDKTEEKQKELKVSNVAQCIKAISFEHKVTREELLDLKNIQEQREIKLSPKVQKLLSNEYELSLSVQITSNVKDTQITLFILSMEYIGIFNLQGDILEEDKERFLLINCSYLLFPFLRTEIANLTLKTGFGSVMLDPVDFGRVYEEYRKHKENEEGSGSRNNGVANDTTGNNSRVTDKTTGEAQSKTQDTTDMQNPST